MDLLMRMDDEEFLPAPLRRLLPPVLPMEMRPAELAV